MRLVLGCCEGGELLAVPGRSRSPADRLPDRFVRAERFESDSDWPPAMSIVLVDVLAGSKLDCAGELISALIIIIALSRLRSERLLLWPPFASLNREVRSVGLWSGSFSSFILIAFARLRFERVLLLRNGMEPVAWLVHAAGGSTLITRSLLLFTMLDVDGTLLWSDAFDARPGRRVRRPTGKIKLLVE